MISLKFLRGIQWFSKDEGTTRCNPSEREQIKNGHDREALQKFIFSDSLQFMDKYRLYPDEKEDDEINKKLEMKIDDAVKMLTMLKGFSSGDNPLSSKQGNAKDVLGFVSSLLELESDALNICLLMNENDRNSVVPLSFTAPDRGQLKVKMYILVMRFSSAVSASNVKRIGFGDTENCDTSKKKSSNSEHIKTYNSSFERQKKSISPYAGFKNSDKSLSSNDVYKEPREIKSPLTYKKSSLSHGEFEQLPKSYLRLITNRETNTTRQQWNLESWSTEGFSESAIQCLQTINRSGKTSLL